MDQDHMRQDVPPYRHSEAAFEQVFKTHFKALHAYAFTFLKDSALAEDMVQTAFIRLWERSEQLQIHRSVSAYLYRSVYHECLNYQKHQKVKKMHETYTKHTAGSHGGDASEKIQVQELEQTVSGALASLPERCRTIFQMSRFESLRYQEIADRLGISVKTVENQMGKALRILRSKLNAYLPFILALLMCLTDHATK